MELSFKGGAGGRGTNTCALIAHEAADCHSERCIIYVLAILWQEALSRHLEQPNRSQAGIDI